MTALWPLLVIGLFVWWLRLPRHHWQAIHPSGCRRRCVYCGEEQDQYVLWVTGNDPPEWWETTKSGNGTCGVSEIPPKWELY